MSIECINVLDANLKEKLTSVKKGILTMMNIPYEGIRSKFEQGEESVTIYNLLPGLEEVEVVERKTKGKSNIYMIKRGLVASISEATLQELLSNIHNLMALIEAGNFGEIKKLNVVPKEIEDIFQTIDRISIKSNENRIDLLYQKYCLALKQLRYIQRENLDFQIYSEKLSR